MSDLDEATENPNIKAPDGKPLDPNVIVPDGDSGINDYDDGEEGKDPHSDKPTDADRSERKTVADAFGIDKRHLHQADDEGDELQRAVHGLGRG